VCHLENGENLDICPGTWTSPNPDGARAPRMTEDSINLIHNPFIECLHAENGPEDQHTYNNRPTSLRTCESATLLHNPLSIMAWELFRGLVSEIATVVFLGWDLTAQAGSARMQLHQGVILSFGRQVCAAR
jgi:hypothetical protein